MITTEIFCTLSNLQQQHIEILEKTALVKDEPAPEKEAEPESDVKTMLSTEIAALTGKRHGDVVRDIRVIIEQLEDDADLRSGFKSSTYLAGNGKLEKCYELDYEATMIVLTGYDVVARAKVIKRWQELEKKANEKPAHIEPPKQSKLIEVKQELSAAIEVLNILGIEGVDFIQLAIMASAENPKPPPHNRATIAV